MEVLTDWISDITGLNALLTDKLLDTIIVLLIVWLLRRLVLKIAFRQIHDAAIRYQWRKSSNVIAYVLCILLLGQVWIAEFSSLATFVGLIAAGLAVALKEPISDLAGWIFIEWRKPFKVGDRVQVGDQAGDVLDINAFRFTLIEIGNWVHAEQNTGRLLYVPNSKVFTDTMANYTTDFGYIWNEIEVVVTFESDWKKAKQLIYEIISKNTAELIPKAQEKLNIIAASNPVPNEKVGSAVYTKINDSGIVLTGRFLTDPRHRRGNEHDIWEDVLDAFSTHDNIAFAYPTQRFYTAGEGKK
jgi:small-conductance mechanosensitive channel